MGSVQRAFRRLAVFCGATQYSKKTSRTQFVSSRLRLTAATAAAPAASGLTTEGDAVNSGDDGHPRSLGGAIRFTPLHRQQAATMDTPGARRSDTFHPFAPSYKNKTEFCNVLIPVLIQHFDLKPEFTNVQWYFYNLCMQGGCALSLGPVVPPPSSPTRPPPLRARPAPLSHLSTSTSFLARFCPARMFSNLPRRRLLTAPPSIACSAWSSVDVYFIET
jgi:hypothetical protein